MPIATYHNFDFNFSRSTTSETLQRTHEVKNLFQQKWCSQPQTTPCTVMFFYIKNFSEMYVDNKRVALSFISTKITLSPGDVCSVLVDKFTYMVSIGFENVYPLSHNIFLLVNIVTKRSDASFLV